MGSGNTSIGISRNAIGDSINDLGLPLGTHMNLTIPSLDYRLELSLHGASLYHSSDEYLRGTLYLYSDSHHIGLNSSYEPHENGLSFETSLDLEFFNLGEFYLNFDFSNQELDFYSLL